MRGIDEDSAAVRKKIIEAYKQHWELTTQAGQIATRMTDIIAPLIAEEAKSLHEAIRRIEEAAAGAECAEFKSDRARDAYLLADKLLERGLTPESVGYSVYNFLRGNDAPENEDIDIEYPEIN